MSQEEKELSQKVVQHFENGEIGLASKLVGENWSVFSTLPEKLRGDEEIALAALISNMQNWNNLPLNLKDNIDFFKVVFNRKNQYSIRFERARDMLFVSEYANRFCFRGYLIPEKAIFDGYGIKKGVNIKRERWAANDLMDEVKDYKNWLHGNLLDDEICRISYLHNKIPGFKLFTYVYASRMAFSFIASDIKNEYM